MSDISDEGSVQQAPLTAGPGAPAIYFDGRSNRRRLVTLKFREQLQFDEPDQPMTSGRTDNVIYLTLRDRCFAAVLLFAQAPREVIEKRGSS